MKSTIRILVCVLAVVLLSGCRGGQPQQTATNRAPGKNARQAEPKYGKRRGRERKKQKYEEMLDFLAETPQENAYLEELIYNGKYALALEIARDNLAIAREMSDHRKVVTYEKYVARLKELT